MCSSDLKKYAFDGLSKTALIALLKQSWKDEEEAAYTDSNDEDEQESEASSKASVSMKDDLITFMIRLFLVMILFSPLI